jgi:hypothetical protein
MEYILFNPMPEPLETGISFAEFCWQITPRSAGASNPQYAFYKYSGVTATATWIALLPQTMGLHQSPLFVTNHESITQHSSLPFGSLNQTLAKKGILNINRP